MVREAKAFVRHAVQSGRLDLFLPIASQVAVPQVVGHDINDVWFAWRGMERAKQDKGKGKGYDFLHLMFGL